MKYFQIYHFNYYLISQCINNSRNINDVIAKATALFWLVIDCLNYKLSVETVFWLAINCINYKWPAVNASATLAMHVGCMQPACSLHAACMACSLHAGCYILHAGGCNLQPPAKDGMQVACRLHAACYILHAACCNLQNARQSAQLFSTTFRCPPTRCSRGLHSEVQSRPALQGPRPPNQSEFYDVASCNLCTFDFLVTFTQSSSFSPVWIRQRTNSYVEFLVTITTGKLFFTKLNSMIRYK